MNPHARPWAIGMGRQKSLLVLDTVTDSDAARLYARLGWTRVGDIPGYACLPSGELSGTTIFYRTLSPDGPA